MRCTSSSTGRAITHSKPRRDSASFCNRSSSTGGACADRELPVAAAGAVCATRMPAARPLSGSEASVAPTERSLGSLHASDQGGECVTA
jgi:hypothetical protein